MRRRYTILAVVAALAVVAWVLAPLADARPAPSGTIAVDPTSSLAYGGHVTFDATVTVPHRKATVYVSVVCAQAAVIVYQWSTTDLDFDFPLADQDGDGLDWPGGAADCEADLIHRLPVGRKGAAVYTTLDTVAFAVSG